MSAFMVSKTHIDILVSAGLSIGHGDYLRWFAKPRRLLAGLTMDQIRAESRTLSYETADEVGQMLTNENVRSLRSRYQDADSSGMTETNPYTFDDHGIDLTPVEVLSAISCYEYQACEHPEWPESEAQDFCDSLRKAMIRTLPGYGVAPWEWNDEEVAKRPRTRRGVRIL